jgi:hypothetical protein
MPDGQEKNPKTKSTKTKERKRGEAMRRIYDLFCREKSAAWTAIFTFVLSVFTGMLYYVADRTDETARATQRAFITFAGTGGGPRLTDPKNPQGDAVAQRIVLNWLNTGNTPARNAVSRVSAQAWRSELPKGFDFPDTGKSEKMTLVLGPKETIGIPIDITIQDLRDTWHGESRLYLWGWIVYNDIFPDSEHHLTQFCAEMQQLTIVKSNATRVSVDDIGKPNIPLQWSTRPCPEHNCYDKDCKDYETRAR